MGTTPSGKTSEGLSQPLDAVDENEPSIAKLSTPLESRERSLEMPQALTKGLLVTPTATC